MKRYTVAWSEDVEVSFISSWTMGNSQTRAILTELGNRVDKNLAVDPDIQGRPHPRFSAYSRIIEIPISSSSAHIVATYEVFSR